MLRRNMLACLAAAGLSAAVRGGRERLSVIADETGETVADWISFAQRHGLHHVELRAILQNGQPSMLDSLPPAKLREIAAQLHGAGLRVSFLNSALLKFTLPGTKPVLTEDWYEDLYRRMGKTPQQLFAERGENLKRVLEAAHIFGTPLIRTFSYWRVAQPRSLYSRLVELFGEMAVTCARAKCRLLIETEYATNVATSEEMRDLMAQLPVANIGINWDPQNSLELEKSPFPDGYAMLPKNRIENVQIKAAGLSGEKRLPWAAIIQAMERAGYKGFYALETHNGSGPKNYAKSDECMRQLIAMMEASRAFASPVLPAS